MKATLIPLLLSISTSVLAEGSTCFGTMSDGRLENGVKLPGSGPNFVSYGSVPDLVGRNYVHSQVSDVIIDAYRRLETDAPGKVFKYAETGYKEGGQMVAGSGAYFFDPRLQSFLYKTTHGDYIKKNIKIPIKRSWMRHDEHCHVDFIVECKPM